MATELVPRSTLEERVGLVGQTLMMIGSLLLERLPHRPDFAGSKAVYRMVAMMARGARDRDLSVVADGDKVPRILAIDYGRKRIGLAISDELGLTAQPLAVLVRTNRREDQHRLKKLCREHAIAHIVVGHPVHIDGQAGEMAEEAARFAARIERETGIPTELADERLTSWEAERVERSKPVRRRMGPLDDLAAAILLRDYLERSRNAGRIPARKA